MPLYENVFIARQDISGAQVDALADGFTQLISEQGGEIKKREYWGLRNLAYRMKKNRKGHYVLFNIEAPPAARTGRAATATVTSATSESPRRHHQPSAPNRPRPKRRRHKWKARAQEVEADAIGPRPPGVRFSGGANPARSPGRTRRRSTTRMCACCSALFPSAARSCRAASRPSRRSGSVSSREPSSGRGFSVCCRMS